jgi:hypothetical protein
VRLGQDALNVGPLHVLEVHGWDRVVGGGQPW